MLTGDKYLSARANSHISDRNKTVFPITGYNILDDINVFGLVGIIDGRYSAQNAGECSSGEKYVNMWRSIMKEILSGEGKGTKSSNIHE